MELNPKKSRVFILNGVGGSGKGEFVSGCFHNCQGMVYKLSMIDKVKESAELIGWDKSKSDKSREALALIKRISECINPGYLRSIVEDKVRGLSKHVEGSIFFIDSREAHDIEALKKSLNAKTILITNDRVKCPECKSDKEIPVDGYDYVISNNGTKEELWRKAKDFMERACE